ncbi:unnamed protein product [Danaus chrysippus]|uniref:Cytochrome c oxidase subunit 7C, mitochondrial n=1 Tax=Danaus chrysippus TaxID=151541 RepID=A0A8J2QYK0_9NEOP|nr:unnamed protein product [Danaus chrysippus]
MLGPVTSRILGQNVMKNFIRNGSHGGVPGENLPFNIHNRTRLTINFLLFALTGISSPFLIVMYQMKKK